LGETALSALSISRCESRCTLGIVILEADDFPKISCQPGKRAIYKRIESSPKHHILMRGILSNKPPIGLLVCVD
jgi:hypothetical protein